MAFSFEQIVSNLSGKLRREKLNGRTYIVVPVTMIVPGVLNGSQGPIEYTENENKKSVPRWNMMPIVINHPVKDGKPVSARSPQVLNQYSVGFVFNAEDDGKLKAEAWLDTGLLGSKAPKVLVALNKNKKVEISTGLGLSLQEKDGKTLAVNYQPDHLAILPDSIGACSIKDGCGLTVNDVFTEEVNNELSHSMLREKLGSLLRNKNGKDSHLWVDDVFETYAIYSLKGVLYQISYSISDSEDVKLVGSPVKVERRVKYVPVSNKKGKTMDKEKLIDAIVNSSCDCWGDDDREILNGFDETKLTKLHDGIVANEKNAKTVEAFNQYQSDDFVVTNTDGKIEVKAKEKEEEPKKESVVNGKKEIKVEDLPEDVRADLDFARTERKKQKDAIVNRLVANVEDSDAKISQAKIYNAMNLDQLRVLDPGEKETELPAPKGRNYAGQGGSHGSTVTNQFDDQKLKLPSLSWD